MGQLHLKYGETTHSQKYILKETPCGMYDNWGHKIHHPFFNRNNQTLNYQKTY